MKKFFLIVGCILGMGISFAEETYGLPENIWNACNYEHNEEKILDMTTDFWCALSPADQAKYAKIYQENYAKSKGLEIERTFTESNAALEMRLIPPGRFWMGSPDEEKGRTVVNEYQHLVIISKAFYIGKFEVTQLQWVTVMGKNPSYFKSDKSKLPVEQVTWEEHAQKFCEKVEVQLPTEAQWEYACRAGVCGMSYLGNFELLGKNNAPLLSKVAIYTGNSGVKGRLGDDSTDWPEKEFPHSKAATHPVGEKEPNAWGIYDMQGNVWEWCEDACDYLNGSVATKTYRDDLVDPKSESSDQNRRIYRGGSWYSNPFKCRIAVRNGDSPTFRSSKLGFRCVKSLESIKPPEASPTPESTPETTTTPEATQTPEATPEASPTPESTPEATQTPEATPETTTTPEATQTPEATPETTTTPESTPETTTTPESTPETTTTPESTPETTTTPEASPTRD